MKKVLLINDTSSENHIGSNAVIQNMHKLCSMNNMEIIGTVTRREVMEWIPRIERRLKQCDIIIINGEGSLHNNPQFMHKLQANMDKFKFQKVVLINTLWQNMTLRPEFLDILSLISFRESLSYNEFTKQYGENKKLSVVPDIIFYTPIKDLQIGVGDSVLDEVNSYLKEQYNYFPMNRTKNQGDVYSYIGWLKSQKLHITGRFHGVCLSVLVGTDFLAIKSNSHKIEGLLKDMMVEDQLIKSMDEVKDKLWDVEVNRQAVQIYVRDSKQKIEDLFKQIGEL